MTSPTDERNGPVEPPPRRRRALPLRLAGGLARGVAGLVVVVLLLVVAASLVIRTDWFREKARLFALDRLRSIVHGQVQVERVEGDLLRGATFTNVRISAPNGEPFVAARRLELNYQLPGLLRQRILLDRVRLEEPRVSLVRDSTGDWNALRILPFLRGGKPGGPAGWGSVVRIDELGIVNGAVRVETRRPDAAFGPLGANAEIEALNGTLAVDLYSIPGEERKRIAADGVSFRLRDPTLEVRRLDADALFTPRGLDLRGVRLETEATKLAGSGTVREGTRPILDLALRGTPLSLIELRRFVPAVPFDGTVTGSVGLAGPSDSLQLTLTDFVLQTGRSRVVGEGTVTTRDEPRVAAKLTFDPLDPADVRVLWGGYPLVEPLNGTLDLKGRSDDLAIDGTLAFGATTSRVSGTLGLAGREPSYDLQIGVQRLDLQDVFHDSSWASVINGDFKLTGAGLGEAARASFGGRIRDSRILFYPLQAGSFSGRFRPGGFDVSAFHMELPHSIVEGAGVVPYDYTVDLQVRGMSRDLQDFYPGIGPTPARRFQAEGRLAGPYSGLDLSLRALADSLAWNGLVTDSLEGTAEFTDIGQSTFRLAMQGVAHDVTYLERIPFREATFEAGFEGDTMGVTVAMRMDSTRTADGHIDVDFSGPAPLVVLDRGTLTLGDESYRIEEPSGFAYQDGVFRFDDFALVHDDERAAIDGTLSLEGAQDFRVDLRDVSLDDLQRLAGLEPVASGTSNGSITVTGTDREPVIHGTFDLSGGRIGRLRAHRFEGGVDYAERRLTLDVDFAPATANADSTDPGSISVKGSIPVDLAFGAVPRRFPDEPLDVTLESRGITLAAVEALTRRPLEASGALDLNVRLEGRPTDPRMRGEISLAEGRFGGLAIHRFDARLGYAERQLQLDVKLEPETPGADSLQSPGSLHAVGTFPLDLSFARVERRVPDAPMDVRVTSEGLTLALLRSFSRSVGRASGPVTVDLHLSGTPSAPRHEGSIAVRDGSVYFRDLGQRFTGINGTVRFDNDRVELQDLRVQSGSGDARLGGRITLGEGDAGGIEAALQARRFTLISDDGKLLVLDADIEFGGTTQQPSVTGKLNVEQASWPLPEQSKKDVIDLDSAILYVRAESDTVPSTPPPDFWRQTLVDVDVSVEDDAVLKSDQALIVLQGDLSIDKPRGREVPSMAGTLEVVRGFYSDFGTQFEVTEGELFFYGTPELNPGLHIVATTTVRNAGQGGQDVEVTLTLGGTLERPTLELTSSPAYEKSEIFSMLLFGSPTPDLTQSAQFTETISRVATSQAALPLQRALATELGLDLLEIQPSIGGTAAFRAGKYIASDVFLSYSQTTGSLDESRFGVQYRLSKNWTVETEAGARQGREQIGADIFYEFQY
jgi:autotransporter translocation and assembly factor TamB